MDDAAAVSVSRMGLFFGSSHKGGGRRGPDQVVEEGEEGEEGEGQGEEENFKQDTFDG